MSLAFYRETNFVYHFAHTEKKEKFGQERFYTIRSDIWRTGDLFSPLLRNTYLNGRQWLLT